MHKSKYVSRARWTYLNIMTEWNMVNQIDIYYEIVRQAVLYVGGCFLYDITCGYSSISSSCTSTIVTLCKTLMIWYFIWKHSLR